MPVPLQAALVAASTSLLVALISPWMIRLAEARKMARSIADEVNLRHLAPLRQQLAETIVRHYDLRRRIELGETEPLHFVKSASEVGAQDWRWFAEHGCYLMSTTYFTARLFAEIARLRDAYPFLRTRARDLDAELTALVLRIQLAFRGVGGVYYAVQQAIGEDMLDEQGRIISYAGFCRAVQDVNQRGLWYEPLIQLYINSESAEASARLAQATAAMEELSLLLDRAVHAETSVSSRVRLEAESMAALRGN